MPRIPQTRSLGALQRNICQSTSTPCSQTFSRALSTSATRSGVTDGLRKKLWKGEAPGPKDPYKKQDSKQDPRMQYLERNQGPLPPEIKQLAEEYFAEGGRRHGGRKVRVPGKRTEAAAEDDVKGADSTYVPATHISELDAVPLVKEWFDDPTNMGAGNGFHGFAPAKGRVITQPDIIKAHVWQALAEALCMRDAGRSARGVSKRLRVPSAALLDKVMQIEIEVLHGQAKIKDAQAAKAIADELRPMPGDSAHGEPIMSLEKAKKVLETAGEGWTDIILAEDVKFIIRKRLFQITGKLIPDAKLAAARNAGHLIGLAGQQPQPTKLAELLSKQNLLDLPNVALHKRKLRLSDKEIPVGRWKLIQEELEKRGIPLLGDKDITGHSESDWVRARR